MDQNQISLGDSISVETREGDAYAGTVDSVLTRAERFDDETDDRVYEIRFTDTEEATRAIVIHDEVTLISKKRKALYTDAELTGETQQVTDIVVE